MLPEHLPESVWEEMTRAERGEYKRNIAVMRTENARMVGNRGIFLHQLEVAWRLKDGPLWFPTSPTSGAGSTPTPRT